MSSRENEQRLAKLLREISPNGGTVHIIWGAAQIISDAASALERRPSRRPSDPVRADLAGMPLHKAAMRLCDLAVRIDRAPEDSKEQHNLCDQRDALLSLFRKADASPRPTSTRREVLEEAAKVAEDYEKSAQALLVKEARYGATSAAIGIASKIRSLASEGE